MGFDFNPSIEKFRESPTRKIDSVKERLHAMGKDIILLSTGQPSIPPPRWVRERLAERLLEEGMELYGYTPTEGRGKTKEAIQRELARLGVEVTLDQLLLTAGGQSAMFSAVLSLFKPGDRVVVFDPMYFGYWPLLDYVGVEAIILRERLEDGFQPPIEELKEVVSREKVKALILVSPDNPTGRVLSREAAEALADLAVDHKFLLVTDEAYRTLVYEGEHVYIYKLAPENVLSLGSFSKDPGIPGWRLAFAYGPAEVIKKMKLVQGETVYCPPSIAQILVEIYLSDTARMQEHLDMVRGVYRRKRDALIEAVEEYLPEARYVKPSGGMFLFLDIADYLRDKRIGAEEFAGLLLERKLVSTVPGVYFSKYYTGGLRLSFVTETPERIREGVRRIGELLGEV